MTNNQKTITLSVYFQRPNADVLLDLGFVDRLQDMVSAIMIPPADDRLSHKRRLVLLTSPDPFNYGTFEFDADRGYAFKLNMSVAPLCDIVRSLLPPFQLFARSQQQSKALCKTVYLHLPDEGASSRERVLCELRKILPKVPNIRILDESASTHSTEDDLIDPTPREDRRSVVPNDSATP